MGRSPVPSLWGEEEVRRAGDEEETGVEPPETSPASIMCHGAGGDGAALTPLEEADVLENGWAHQLGANTGEIIPHIDAPLNELWLVARALHIDEKAHES
jgi:hypothetical protein